MLGSASACHHTAPSSILMFNVILWRKLWNDNVEVNLVLFSKISKKYHVIGMLFTLYRKQRFRLQALALGFWAILVSLCPDLHPVQVHHVFTWHSNHVTRPLSFATVSSRSRVNILNLKAVTNLLMSNLFQYFKGCLFDHKTSGCVLRMSCTVGWHVWIFFSRNSLLFLCFRPIFAVLTSYSHIQKHLQERCTSGEVEVKCCFTPDQTLVFKSLMGTVNYHQLVNWFHACSSEETDAIGDIWAHATL